MFSHLILPPTPPVRGKCQTFLSLEGSHTLHLLLFLAVRSTFVARLNPVRCQVPPTLSPPGARHISWSGLKAGTRQAGFRGARGRGESSLVNLNRIGQTVIFDNFSFGTSSFAHVNRFKKQDTPPSCKKPSIKDNSQASKTFQPLATGAWAEGNPCMQ